MMALSSVIVTCLARSTAVATCCWCCNKHKTQTLQQWLLRDVARYKMCLGSVQSYGRLISHTLYSRFSERCNRGLMWRRVCRWMVPGTVTFIGLLDRWKSGQRDLSQPLAWHGVTRQRNSPKTKSWLANLCGRTGTSRRCSRVCTDYPSKGKDKPISVAARYKAWLAKIAVRIPSGAWMSICWECCV